MKDKIWIWDEARRKARQVPSSRVLPEWKWGSPNQVAISRPDGKKEWGYVYFSKESAVDCWRKARAHEDEEVSKLESQLRALRERIEGKYPRPEGEEQ